MTAVFIFIALVVGWCGTLPPPKPRPPVPKDPLPGMIGGVVGAYIVYYALGLGSIGTGLEFVAVMAGAYAFGAVIQDLANRLFKTA